MDEHPINKRIREFALDKNLRNVDLERITGASNGYFGRLTKGAYSTEFIAKIFERFPDLSPDWILNGEGEMYRHNSGALFKDDNNATTQIVDAPKEDLSKDNSCNADYIDRLLGLLEHKDEQIDHKDEQISKLIDIISSTNVIPKK